MNSLHLIERGNLCIGYNRDNYELFTVKDRSALQTLYNDINGEQSLYNNDTELDTVITTSRNIDRITLCIANDCNLRCKYCYAKGGNYGMERNLMDEETAYEFVNFCYRELNSLGSILFFGGEPLLNWKIIALICKEFKKRGGKLRPAFYIVTNGTLYSPSILELIQKYINAITVSIDGNRIINDANRVYKNGTGSYQHISYFIKQITSKTNVEIHYEATYNQVHLREHISRYDVQRFLTSEFGIDGTVIDEENLNRQDILNYLSSITKQKLLDSQFKCLTLDFWQILHSVIHKVPVDLCTIMGDRFAVTTNGNIFGCQLLIGKNKNLLCNIREINVLDKVHKAFHNYRHNEICEQCWCYGLCGGCTVQRYYDNEQQKLSRFPKKVVCNYTKKYIEEILIIIYKIRMDTDLWHGLITKLTTN